MTGKVAQFHNCTECGAWLSEAGAKKRGTCQKCYAKARKAQEAQERKAKATARKNDRIMRRMAGWREDGWDGPSD